MKVHTGFLSLKYHYNYENMICKKWICFFPCRCDIQGIAPPVERFDDLDFDPGAKFHVPNNTPYIRWDPLKGICYVNCFTVNTHIYLRVSLSVCTLSVVLPTNILCFTFPTFAPWTCFIHIFSDFSCIMRRFIQTYSVSCFTKNSSIRLHSPWTVFIWDCFDITSISLTWCECTMVISWIPVWYHRPSFECSNFCTRIRANSKSNFYQPNHFTLYFIFWFSDILWATSFSSSSTRLYATRPDILGIYLNVTSTNPWRLERSWRKSKTICKSSGGSRL